MRLTLFVILFLALPLSYAQVSPTDTEPIPNSENTVDSLKIDDLADEKNALYSAVIPGWGQVRNQQYIKAGAILGAFSYGLVNTIDYTKDFKDYDDQYSQLILDYDNTVNDVSELNELWDLRQDVRNKKDIWTGVTTYVYVGNLIDAAAQYKILREDPTKHSATKAAYYSAILPGLGQAYNKKYWKIPLVYAALGTSLYVARENRNYHRDYLKEIQYRSVEETTGFRTFLDEDRLEENLEYWRKWRDAAYIITGVVYFLNVVDATVDAHLYDFTVDDELSFDVSPVFDQFNGEPYYAVQLSFPINNK